MSKTAYEFNIEITNTYTFTAECREEDIPNVYEDALMLIECEWEPNDVDVVKRHHKWIYEANPEYTFNHESGFLE